MPFTGLTQAGAHTHHCPVCHKSAKSSCVNKGHLRKCTKCNQSYPPSLNPDGCPYCKQQRDAERARAEKEQKKGKDKDDKNKKGGSSSGASKKKTKK